MADQKVTELTELTAASSDDILHIIDDPSGTPVNKKITVANLLATTTYKVQDDGADNTGATDAASAIRTTIAAADAVKQTQADLSLVTGTAPAVDFGTGVYQIGSQLVSASGAGINYMEYIGQNAMLVDTGRTVTCFDLEPMYQVGYQGIIFRGFDTQVSIDTNNSETQITFYRCRFVDPASYAVLTSTDSNSTQMVFQNCVFDSDEAGAVMVDSLCDTVLFNNCFIKTANNVSFINRNHMHFSECLFIPEGTNSGKAWVHNYGERLHFEKCRIGGEGGGRTLFCNYADADATGTINPVHIIVENLEGYSTDEFCRLYGLPNVLKIDGLLDDQPTGADDGIWVDSSITDAEIEDWMRFGTVDIDPLWNRNVWINNEDVATIATIKNLRNHPVLPNNSRVPVSDVISTGDSVGGWSSSTTTTGSQVNTNEYGATEQTFTATGDDQTLTWWDPDFLVRGDLSRKTYTYCHEIAWEPNSGTGQLELYARVGGEQYKIDLLPGNRLYCLPFYYLNGGGAGDDQSLDEIRFETGSRFKNGDVLRFRRWFLLDGLWKVDNPALQMVGNAAPVAITNTVGPNQSFFIGDIVWDAAPVAAADMGWTATVAGDPGTWVTFGAVDGTQTVRSDGDTGGSGSAGTGNQYIEIDVNGTVYKVLHDGTV